MGVSTPAISSAPTESLPTSLPTSVAELAARIAGSVPALASCRLVCIDGPSGAGKTVLTDQLAERLGADFPDLGVQVVHVDELCRGWDDAPRVSRRVREDLLVPLAVGLPGLVPTWDWVESAGGPVVRVPVSDVVLAEGVGAYGRSMEPWPSLVIWVDAPEPVRQARAFARDGDGYRPHWAGWAADERVVHEREGTRARANVRLDTAS
ncbi:MAG: 4-amino-4-deoxy-L-arabinose transferase [Nocardioidaceae bacterium]